MTAQMPAHSVKRLGDLPAECLIDIISQIEEPGLARFLWDLVEQTLQASREGPLTAAPPERPHGVRGPWPRIVAPDPEGPPPLPS